MAFDLFRSEIDLKHPRLERLYEQAKQDFWNDTTAIDWDQELTLNADDSIDGIITLGPNGATQALAALSASGFQGRIKLATFDLSPNVLSAVQDGRIQFAVDQQPYLEGYLPIVLLAERARHGLFPAAGGLIPTGPRFVTPDNVGDAIRLSREGVR